MHFSGEILVIPKFMGIFASTSKRVGFHTFGVLVFFWIRKSSIQCLPWSLGRVGLDKNSAQVRITKQEVILSRPNKNILIKRMILYFYHSQKSRVNKWLSEFLNFLSF